MPGYSIEQLSVQQLKDRITQGQAELEALKERRGSVVAQIAGKKAGDTVPVHKYYGVMEQPVVHTRRSRLAAFLKMLETGVFSLFTRQRTENMLFHTVARFTAFPVLVGLMLIQTIAAGINLRREAQKANTDERQLKWATLSFVSSAIITGLAVASVALIFAGLYLAIAPILLVTAFAVGTVTSAVYAIKDTVQWWRSRKELIERCRGPQRYKNLETEYAQHVKECDKTRNDLKELKQEFRKNNPGVSKKNKAGKAYYESFRKQGRKEEDFEYHCYLRETFPDRATEYLEKFNHLKEDLRTRQEFTNYPLLKQFAACQHLKRRTVRGFLNVVLGVFGTIGAAILMIVAPGVSNIVAGSIAGGSALLGTAVVVDEIRDPDAQQRKVAEEDSLDRKIEKTKKKLQELEVRFQYLNKTPPDPAAPTTTAAAATTTAPGPAAATAAPPDPAATAAAPAPDPAATAAATAAAPDPDPDPDPAAAAAIGGQGIFSHRDDLQQVPADEAGFTAGI